MALDTAGSTAEQNGGGNAPDAEADPADQTAIEEASVIHLLRVLVAEAAPPVTVSEDAMDHESPCVAHALDVNDITCEEAGCLLWDMSASRPVAQVMLRNRALEALEIVIARELQVVQSADRPEASVPPAGAARATPTAADGSLSPEHRQAPQEQQQEQQQRDPTPKALRILEVCLGTLANLIVTQPTAAVAVSSRPELRALLLFPRSPDDDDPDRVALPMIGGSALYVDDARVLSELFRFLSLALRCQGSAVWLSALSSPAALQRIMWVGAATADTQLFARFLDMIVAFLHAASGSAAEAVAAPDRNPVSASAAAVVPSASLQPPVGSQACCRVLLDCDLMGLLHQVLLQALRACMPAEEKYTELDSGDADAFAGTVDTEQGTGASPPSVVSGSATANAGRSGAVVETATATVAGGRASDASPVATGSLAEVTPRSNGSCRVRHSSEMANVLVGEVQEEVLRGFAGSGSCGPGPGSPSDDAAVAGAVGAVGATAAAATAAVASVGPVPLSDEAVDAALRLIEELVSPSGPFADPHDGAGSPSGAGAGAAGGSSAAEQLLKMHAERGLRPGMMQLLLGLLRYQYDSMQVVEGLLVVLVDLGTAVPGAVAASPPEVATAVVARLMELLQDSSFSPADGAPSSIVQLQQGAWYLLAAILRGTLAAVAAAAAAGADDSVAATGPAFKGAASDMELLATGVQAQAQASSGLLDGWRANWTSLERSLSGIPEMPRPDGCLSYVRACCVAGMRLLEELWGPQMEAAAVGAATAGGNNTATNGAGGRRRDQQRSGGPSQRFLGAETGSKDVKSALQQGEEGSHGSSPEESLVRLRAALRSMLCSLDG